MNDPEDDPPPPPNAEMLRMREEYLEVKKARETKMSDTNSSAPEKIWAWHWHSEWDANPPASGPKAIAQSGHCRPTTRHALDERERWSGAEYIRIDLHQAALAELEANLITAKKEPVMNKEEAVVTKLVRSLLDNGAMEGVLVAILEAALEDNLADLERLSKKKTLQVHEFADYAHNIEFSKAAIKVLQYFSTDHYLGVEDLVMIYEEKYPLEAL